MAPQSFPESRLLSGRNRMSVIEREQVLAQVLQQTARPSAARRLAPWLLGSAAAAASLALLLLLLPGTPASQGEFASRGNGAQQGFALSCVDATGPGDCHRGSRLLFQTWAPAGQPYFASLARGSDGTILWYAPSGDQERSLDTRQAGPGGVLATGIQIGPEHPAGRLTVYGLFSAAPLDKAEVRARVERAVQDKVVDPSLFSLDLTLGDAP